MAMIDVGHLRCDAWRVIRGVLSVPVYRAFAQRLIAEYESKHQEMESR